MFKLDTLQEESISLLKELITIKSFSFEEDKTASKIEFWLNKKDIETKRIENNIRKCLILKLLHSNHVLVG